MDAEKINGGKKVLTEQILTWTVVETLILDLTTLLVTILLVYLALKIAVTLQTREANPIPPPRADWLRGGNPYVHIARALEQGDHEAILWLLSQNTRKSRVMSALNQVAVDLMLGASSLLAVSTVYIKLRGLPAPDWILILAAATSVILTVISIRRVRK